MSKTAVVYKTAKNIIISKALTVDGLWLNQMPCYKLDCDIEESVIGDKTLEALSLSQENIPRPNDFGLFGQKVLDSLGLRGYPELQKDGIKNCFIEARNNNIGIIPTKNVGNGFDHLPHMIIELCLYDFS